MKVKTFLTWLKSLLGFRSRQTHSEEKCFQYRQRYREIGEDWDREDWDEDIVANNPKGGLIYSHHPRPLAVLAWGSYVDEVRRKRGSPRSVYLSHQDWDRYQRSPESILNLSSLGQWMSVTDFLISRGLGGKTADDIELQIYRDPTRDQGPPLFSWESSLPEKDPDRWMPEPLKPPRLFLSNVRESSVWKRFILSRA